MIVGLISVIPDGRLKHQMDFLYLEEFNALISA